MIETTSIETSDGPAEAWVARGPQGVGGPGVLFYVDAIGLRPQIASMMERIAGWGFTVLAPHVFHRAGSVDDLAPQTDLTDPAGREQFMQQAMARVQDLDPERTDQDAAAWLAALDEIAPGSIGVTGYCMGARLAMRVAGQDPDRIVAVGGFHGGRLATSEPDSPRRRLAAARAEFVLLHADQDRSMTPDDVAALDRAFDAAGLNAVNEIVPGAPHGYTMADTSSWDEAASERHFAALQDLLTRRLLADR